jgi:hypothetical protein
MIVLVSEWRRSAVVDAFLHMQVSRGIDLVYGGGGIGLTGLVS